MSTNYAPRGIVSLQPSATLILRDLGKLDLLVACTKYCAEACPEVAERGTSIVADSWTAQSDQIRALQPDFVIASVPYQEKSVIEILKANTPFLALAPKKLADIYSDIAIIARIAGKRRRDYLQDAGRDSFRARSHERYAEGSRLLRRMGQAFDRFTEVGG